MKYMGETELIIDELKMENQSLRSILQLSSETYADIDQHLQALEQMPEEVQQKLLTRIDETNAKRAKPQHIDEDPEYI